MDVHANTTPEQRLAIERKEFGEYGGVNASVEVSTTFTGANGSVDCCLPTSWRRYQRAVSMKRAFGPLFTMLASCCVRAFRMHRVLPSMPDEGFVAAVMTAATMPAIFTGDVGPDKGGRIGCSGTKH